MAGNLPAFAEGWFSQMPLFVRRAMQLDQMELDSALSQMYSLCVNPSLVNKMSRARKATKNRFYRDDPAFLVLQVFFIIVSSIAVGCTFGPNFQQVAEHVVLDVVWFFIWALIITSGTWWLVNKWLLDEAYIAEIHREVDWRYSLDVHCNGYFFYFMWTKLICFIFLPITLNFAFLGNAVYLFGVAGYFYNVFLGYLELPMLAHQQRLIYPIPVVAVFTFLATTVFGWSWPRSSFVDTY